ncbi:MAG: aminoacyl-tRNA hydrolase [Lachnospiraceae bacterium]|nr:aminoacyl-tRNA hydrolase [Lachnospiraceae bacterium]
MYIIVGLGNPGLKYAKTKHNMGFMTIDVLADRYRIDLSKRMGQAYCGQGIIEGQKVLLVKPQTYMNLSGESVAALTNFYKIDVSEELIIIYDDISLEPGNVRVRKKGSAGGHNGMKNIIKFTGTEEFMRVRVGIGGPSEHSDLVDHVLHPFEPDVIPLIEEGIDRAADATVSIISEGIEITMNKFNRKVSGES